MHERFANKPLSTRIKAAYAIYQRAVAAKCLSVELDKNLCEQLGLQRWQIAEIRAKCLEMRDSHGHLRPLPRKAPANNSSTNRDRYELRVGIAAEVIAALR